MTSLEYVALDLYLSNQTYTQSLADLGAGTVTYSFYDAPTTSMSTIDVSGWAAIASADWQAFESQIQAYFGFDTTLNDQLQAAGIETVTLAGCDFMVGGWY